MSKPKPAPNSRVRPVHLLLLVLLVALAYSRVTDNSFITTFDDQQYITSNPHVQAGLTLSGLHWAFTTTRAANWHPLTWISHMLDWQLFGPNPAGHHLANLLFHIGSTLLLFLILNLITACPRRSLFVAALFAIHPLHVESVAWAAERKDVLSTFFWMLTILAYIGYVRKPGVGRYLLMIGAFALGLMAKPMLVSLPLVLLLLDFWPLRRSLSALRLVLEKTPLLAITAVSCVVTLWAQRAGGAIRSVEACSLGVRAANAAVASVEYIIKMVWPSGLSVFYPHPLRSLPEWQVIGSVLLLVGAFVLAAKWSRTRPYATMGWLWYVITLLPVVGLVQVGGQGMADRYTYIPLIGIFIAATWLIADASIARPSLRAALPVLACVVVLAMAARTYIEVAYWRDSRTLFTRAVQVTSRNYVAHYSLGVDEQARQHWSGAAREYREALEINPRDFDARTNLALTLMADGKFSQAHDEFVTLLRSHPRSTSVCEGVAMSLSAQGKKDEALEFCAAAVKANPRIAGMHYNLANAYADLGKFDEADKEFREAIRLNPRDPRPHHNLGLTFKHQGRMDAAIKEFREAVRLHPGDPGLRESLASALLATRDYAGASEQVQEIIRCGEQPDPELLKALHERTGER